MLEIPIFEGEKEADQVVTAALQFTEFYSVENSLALIKYAIHREVEQTVGKNSLWIECSLSLHRFRTFIDPRKFWS
jgi:hypothetical protein